MAILRAAVTYSLACELPSVWCSWATEWSELAIPISAADGIARREWVPVASVPGLIAAGEIRSAETLLGLRMLDR